MIKVLVLLSCMVATALGAASTGTCPKTAGFVGDSTGSCSCTASGTGTAWKWVFTDATGTNLVTTQTYTRTFVIGDNGKTLGCAGTVGGTVDDLGNVGPLKVEEKKKPKVDCGGTEFEKDKEVDCKCVTQQSATEIKALILKYKINDKEADQGSATPKDAIKYKVEATKKIKCKQCYDAGMSDCTESDEHEIKMKEAAGSSDSGSVARVSLFSMGLVVLISIFLRQ